MLQVPYGRHVGHIHLDELEIHEPHKLDIEVFYGRRNPSFIIRQNLEAAPQSAEFVADPLSLCKAVRSRFTPLPRDLHLELGSQRVEKNERMRAFIVQTCQR